MTGIFTSGKFTKMWKIEMPITHVFQRASASPRPRFAAISFPYEEFQCKAYRNKRISNEIQLQMRRRHHIACTCSESIALLSARSRRKDSTIVYVSLDPGSKPILSWKMKRRFWLE